MHEHSDVLLCMKYDEETMVAACALGVGSTFKTEGLRGLE